MEDEKIIALYFQRNEQAIKETDTAYGRKLWMLAKNILSSREDAEESVYDTYMRSWETIPPQRPRHFYGYLAALCRNLSLNKVDWRLAAKRHAEIVTLTEEMELCIPDARQEAMMERRELRRVLEAFLDSLSTENRLIFLRRYLYADSIADICKRYDLSESKVKTQLHRTRNKLRETLLKEEIYV